MTHTTHFGQRSVSIINELFLIVLLSLSVHALLFGFSNVQIVDEDTVIVNDTLEEPVKIHVIPYLGSIDEPSFQYITYLDHLFMEYQTSGDNLNVFPGIFIRNKGAIGQPNEVTAYGLEWRSIGVLNDGRPVNDPLIGIYDFIFYPTENIEYIEYLPPWRSFLYQRSAVGAGFNIVSQNYIAPTPYTRIRYSEGPFNYSQTDVTLSQDIMAGLNVVVGIQRHFFGRSEPQQFFRGRFPNMNYRGENYRTKIRWNFSKWMNLALMYNYTNTFSGLSGGVDIINTPEEDIFSDLEAVVRSLNARQRFFRHDLSLTAGLQLLPDTLDTGHVSIFYTSLLREYRDDNRTVDNDTLGLRATHLSSIGGLNFRQWFTVGPVRVQAGGIWQGNRIEQSDNTGAVNENELGLFGRVLFMPFRLFNMNLMIRQDFLRSSDYTSYGADVTISVSQLISMTLGGVHTYRQPTLQELHWQDKTIIRSDSILPETHNLFFAEVHFNPISPINITAGLLARRVDDPIQYLPGQTTRLFPDVVIQQGKKSEIISTYLRSKFSWGDFSVIGYAATYQIKENGINRKPLPPIDLRGEIIYRSLLFNANLDLQVKLQAHYIGEQYGVEFNPETYFTTPQFIARIGPSAILDGSIVGKIGNAHIHITYRNIAGTEYMLTPFYPMYESYLRFGITWEFLN